MNDLDLMAAEFQAARRTAAAVRRAAWQSCARRRRRRLSAGFLAVRRSPRRGRSSRRTMPVARNLLDESDRGQGRTRAAARHQDHRRDNEGDRTRCQRRAGHDRDGHLPRSIRITCGSSRTARRDAWSRCSTATQAWVKDPDGTHDVPESRCMTSRRICNAIRSRCCLPRTTAGCGCGMLLDAKDEAGRAPQRDRVLRTDDLDPMVLYIDPASHLIVKQTYVTGGAGRPLVEEAVQRLPRRRRCPDRASHDRTRERRSGARPPRHEVRDQHTSRTGSVHPPGLLTLRILLSCGEPSGDLYAGALTRELRTLRPDIDIAGRAGPEFARAGGRLLADYRGLAVTGFTEIVSKVPAAPRGEAPPGRCGASGTSATRWSSSTTPASTCGWRAGSNELGIPVIYYVSPQIWAWRPGRIKALREIADRVLVIFPFEEAIYRDAGVPVEFVGHPLIDLARSDVSRADFLRGLGLDPSAPTIAVLPGSRSSELRRILPDARRRGAAHSRGRSRGAVRRRARAASRRPAVRARARP